MKAEIAEKLALALESGEYEKGTGSLRSCDDKFCCLGVLCDLYHKETGEGEWVTHDDGIYFYDGGQSSSVVLIDTVLNWSGMSFNNGTVNDLDPTPLYKGEHNSKSYGKNYKTKALAEANDWAPITFPEMAALIRKNAHRL